MSKGNDKKQQLEKREQQEMQTKKHKKSLKREKDFSTVSEIKEGGNSMNARKSNNFMKNNKKVILACLIFVIAIVGIAILRTSAPVIEVDHVAVSGLETKIGSVGLDSSSDVANDEFSINGTTVYCLNKGSSLTLSSTFEKLTR